MTATSVLPGVDLVTEEVEPGVYRVLSDGVRDLSREIRLALDAFGSDISVAPDGSVWYFGPDGSYRIGDASRAITDLSEPVNPRSIEWATDGTAWGTTGQLVRFADGSWTAEEDFPRNTSVGAVGVAPDGVVWAVSDNGKNGRVSRLDADGWTHFDAVPRVQIGDLEPGHDDDVWLIGGQERPTLVHFDGSGWNVDEPAGVPPDHRATLIEMAADGALWAYFGAGETGPGYLGRYQDGRVDGVQP